RHNLKQLKIGQKMGRHQPLGMFEGVFFAYGDFFKRLTKKKNPVTFEVRATKENGINQYAFVRRIKHMGIMSILAECHF
ncbi:hypothetical protein CJ307_34940, partial [Klebsiella quasipneumoniae]